MKVILVELLFDLSINVFIWLYVVCILLLLHSVLQADLFFTLLGHEILNLILTIVASHLFLYLLTVYILIHKLLLVVYVSFLLLGRTHQLSLVQLLLYVDLRDLSLLYAIE